MQVAYGRGSAPETLGYRRALDAGAAAAEHGASELALVYFDRASSLRPTRFALAQKASVLRDLGRLHESEQSYRDALAAHGGTPRYARVGLAAVLCDQGRFEEALEVAQMAVADEPRNPAALHIVARCISEQTDAMRDSTVEPGYLAELQAQADSFRQLAWSLEEEDPADRLRRRRERAFPLHSIAAATEPTVPLEQLSGTPTGSVADTQPTSESGRLSLAGSAMTSGASAGRLRRWLRRLRVRLG